MMMAGGGVGGRQIAGGMGVGGGQGAGGFPPRNAGIRPGVRGGARPAMGGPRMPGGPMGAMGGAGGGMPMDMGRLQALQQLMRSAGGGGTAPPSGGGQQRPSNTRVGIGVPDPLDQVMYGPLGNLGQPPSPMRR